MANIAKQTKIIDIQLPQEWESVELYPLSDLHIGDPRTDKRMFLQFLEHIKAAPNRFLLFNGDNSNNAIKSSVSNIYEEEMTPREQKIWLRENLQCVKDRFLIFTPGNHEDRSVRETDTHMIEDLAENLGLEDLYRSEEALIKLSFGVNPTNPERKVVYSIYITHGNGGGKRAGSTINNLELLGLSIDADIYIVGHSHKRIAYKSGFRRPDLRNNKIVQAERLFVCSSSWSDFGGYAARKMLIPSAKGSVPITLDGRKKEMFASV